MLVATVSPELLVTIVSASRDAEEARQEDQGSRRDLLKHAAPASTTCGVPEPRFRCSPSSPAVRVMDENMEGSRSIEMSCICEWCE
jgi:hypothetical protein